MVLLADRQNWSHEERNALNYLKRLRFGAFNVLTKEVARGDPVGLVAHCPHGREISSEELHAKFFSNETGPEIESRAALRRVIKAHHDYLSHLTTSQRNTPALAL